MINLYKEMKNIVEDTTKSYKSDFYEHDVKNILNGGPQIYLWLPYYAGTCLLPVFRLFYKNDFAYTLAKHYLGYDPKVIRAFLIDVTEIRRTSFYGEIKELKNFDKLINIINKNNIEYESMHILVNGTQKLEITAVEEEQFNGRIIDIIKKRMNKKEEYIDSWRLLKYVPTISIPNEFMINKKVGGNMKLVKKPCSILQSIDKSFQQIKEFKKGKRQLKSLEKSKRLWNKWIKE